MGALKTLEYTGIDVDDPQNITELTKPTDILDSESDDKGKRDLASSGAKEIFSGQSIADLKYNENPDHITKYGSYSEYLSGTGTLTDRLPTIGNITEPLVAGTFLTRFWASIVRRIQRYKSWTSRLALRFKQFCFKFY